PLDRFLCIWFAVVYGLFSLSRTQLPHYILYGATPLFLLMAKHRALLRSRWLTYAPGVLSLVVMLWLPELLAAMAAHTDDAYVAEVLAAAPAAFDRAYRLGIVLSLLCVLAVAVMAGRHVIRGLLTTAFVHAIALIALVMPRLGDLQQGPVHAAVRFSSTRPETIVAYGVELPSFSLCRNAVTEAEAGEQKSTRLDSSH